MKKRRSVDPYEDLSKEEIEKKMDEFASMDITKEEEKAMIKAALKTFLPPIIILVLLFYGVAYLLIR